jgi:hypothetical protein
VISRVRVGLLLVLLLAAGGRGAAAEVYVAPVGRDDNPGTLEKPFATVQRAQTAAAPGDTVLIRGGTYRMTEAQITRTQGIFARVTVLDRSGEPGKPITYRAYQDERPVFDLSAVKPAGKRVTAFYVSGSWLHLVGLDVTGVQVTIKTHTQSICFESQGSNNVFERLSMHDGQAIGLYHVRGKDNLFLNCDAWNNWDRTSEDGKGGNVDGFGCHPPRGSTGNVFRGCRAWFNSDDGYDCINSHEPVVFENCWAMYNGLSPARERLADGNGFKAGGYGSRPAAQVSNPVPQHVVRFCVAVDRVEVDQGLRGVEFRVRRHAILPGIAVRIRLPLTSALPATLVHSSPSPGGPGMPRSVSKAGCWPSAHLDRPGREPSVPLRGPSRSNT